MIHENWAQFLYLGVACSHMEILVCLLDHDPKHL